MTFIVFTKPHSDGGKLIRKLCFVNGAGWLVLLLFGSEGHPPGYLIPLILFWLLNVVLIPAASTALLKTRREADKTVAYSCVAGTYILLNLVVLFVIPLTMLLVSVSR